MTQQQHDTREAGALLQRWMTAHPDGKLPTTEELLAWMNEPSASEGEGEGETTGSDAPYTASGPVPQPSITELRAEIEHLERMLGIAIQGVNRAWYEGRDAAMNSEDPGALTSPYEHDEGDVPDLDT